MTATLAAREEVLVVRGGIGETSRSVVDAAQAHGYSAVASGPGTFRLARTTRPAWARFLTFALFPFLGLGLLFLLVRTREEATVSVFEDREGTKVRVIGLNNPTLVAAFRVAAPPRPTGVPLDAPAVPTTPTEEPVAPQLDPATMIRRSESPPVMAEQSEAEFGATMMRPKAAPPATPRPALHLPDGTVWKTAPGVVLGRQPTKPDGYSGFVAYELHDQSVSKTHASVAVDETGVFVTDLHSTNGTLIVHEGCETRCVPGRQTAVPLGAVIHLGDVVLRTSSVV